jgi:hypothetical protein
MVDFSKIAEGFDRLDFSPARPPFLNNRLINLTAAKAQR